MEQQQSITLLETEKVSKLMRMYAIPCIISLLVAALYNIVDQIFIANADYLGSYGNAANTVVYPLTVLAVAVAVLIGDGCCAFVSISLGHGRPEDAHRSIGNSIILCILASVLITLIYLLFSDQILTIFGGRANEETFALAKEYFFWITVGIPFYIFGQAMNPVIRSDGSPRYAMASTLVGTAANIILDPLFIYGFHWGMTGAAIATVIGQILTAVLSIVYLTRMKVVKLSRSSFGLFGGLMRRFLPLGITSFLAQASLVLSIAAINSMCTKYGAMDPVFGQSEFAQIPLAVLGIVMKFFQIVISVSIGMAAGCIPVVGYNVGAGHLDRTKQLFTCLLTCEAILGLAGTLIVELFPVQLIGIFGAANESAYYTEFAVKSFRIYLCLMVLSTLNKGTFIFLQAMGKAFASTLISLNREMIFGVGLALLLPIWFGLDGLLCSFPLADALTFLIALGFIIKTYQELNQKVPASNFAL